MAYVNRLGRHFAFAGILAGRRYEIFIRSRVYRRRRTYLFTSLSRLIGRRSSSVPSFGRLAAQVPSDWASQLPYPRRDSASAAAASGPRPSSTIR
jgi:hypothetical protein